MWLLISGTSMHTHSQMFDGWEVRDKTFFLTVLLHWRMLDDITSCHATCLRDLTSTDVANQFWGISDVPKGYVTKRLAINHCPVIRYQVNTVSRTVLASQKQNGTKHLHCDAFEGLRLMIPDWYGKYITYFIALSFRNLKTYYYF